MRYCWPRPASFFTTGGRGLSARASSAGITRSCTWRGNPVADVPPPAVSRPDTRRPPLQSEFLRKLLEGNRWLALRLFDRFGGQFGVAAVLERFDPAQLFGRDDRDELLTAAG